MTLPAVSIPTESGATSTRRTSLMRLDLDYVRIAAWIAAPYATASSGLIDLFGSLPLKKSLRIETTFGILVEPPTRTISSISLFDTFASVSTCSTGGMHCLKYELQSSSNLDLVIFIRKSYPSASVSTSMEDSNEEESMRFARSHYVRRRLIALGFPRISIFVFLRKFSAQNSTSLLSKSSPPRCVSPAVAMTSNKSPSIESKETSKVPPPRSKIRTFFSDLLF